MVAQEGFEPSVEDPKSSALPLGHWAASLNTSAEGGGDRPGRVTWGRVVALGLVMRNVVLAGLVLLTAACGAYQFPGASPAATGTVTGTVAVMPCGPIKPMPPVQPGRPGPPTGPPQDSVPCRMTPAVAVEMVFSSGDSVTSTLTDPNGRYRIELPEGTYKVSAKNYRRIITGPAVVTVKAGSTVTADYLLDSGIRRLPVPNQ